MTDRQKDGLLRLFSRLWVHISQRRRVQFGLLFILMIVSSFAEIISIGALLPFLGVLMDPETLFAHSRMQPIIGLFGFTSPGQLLLPLTIGFAGAVFISGAIRLLLQWVRTRLSHATGADLSIDVYRKTLYQPYAMHVSRNSSELISGITSKTNSVTASIGDVLTILSSLFLLSGILLALFVIDPFVAFVGIGGFGAIYAIIIKATRKRQRAYGGVIAKEQVHVVKSLQEGLGGIRDVLIDGTQPIYCGIYRRADGAYRQAIAKSEFISQSPRFAIEAFAVMLIAALAYILAHDSEHIAKAIPVLGALALGAQRLLPVLQALYASWSGILAREASLRDSLDLLEQPMPAHADEPVAEPIAFADSITLSNLSFRYVPEAPMVLDGVDLTIPKGSRVGFIGATGSGKSTLLDIIMGLLKPTGGELRIDGVPVTDTNHRAWQAHIAHVPQAIFLADTSIEENIAFGVPKKEIDHERVRRAAQQAQIAGIIESWPKQYQTFVGERGVRLSGGQRQRIGIARALYKQADVIIFDEATSALDNKTEEAVMQAIENLHEDLTVLIIAHRLTTLRNCDRVVELEHGRVGRMGSYREIVGAEGVMGVSAAG
ncbi:ABC transporter ATP-binding protein [Chlorobium phaeovibrioides]|nr:ABC transporter ATP-binding protein [Chlorobium phaeovibrioides]